MISLGSTPSTMSVESSEYRAETPTGERSSAIADKPRDAFAQYAMFCQITIYCFFEILDSKDFKQLK